MMLCILYKLGESAHQTGWHCVNSKGTQIQSGFFFMGNHMISKFPLKQIAADLNKSPELTEEENRMV